MEPEEETGSSSQNQNLHDLQNYLVTFKNEIENSDDVLTNIGVDSSDVNDLYPGPANHDLQDPGEPEEVSGQFSSGFYSEQGMLGTTLSDESTQQQIQNMVSSVKQGGESVMNPTKDDVNVNTIDLDSMQAQMAVAGYTDTQLNQSLQGMQTGSAQGIIMTSLDDSLNPTNGKMIQIVSLGGEDGQYLSLAEGQQMQILNSDDLGLTSESLAENLDSAVDLNSSSTATVISSSHSPMALVSLAGNTLSAVDMSSNNSEGGGTGINIVATDIKEEVGGSSSHVAASSTAAASSTSTIVGGNGAASLFNAVGGVPQLVALSGAGEGGQPQLFALHRPGLTAESLQMNNLLGTTDGVNQDLACHTITIVPSDLAQTGDMNYVLVLSQPDDGQGDKVASVAQLCDLKQEATELGDAIVDENGITKNMLRLFPKKYVNDINQPLVCDYCNYTSPKRYLLTRHMKSHSEERPFKCEACHRGFKTPASLLNHVNTHTGTRPHKCKTCEAAFTTSGELVRHIRYRHTFEKPHRCPECDYASVELSKLKRHMRSHTGERPYKCPNCPYASPDTYKLKRHMRIHTGEKPYECDICHARFTQSNSLKAHKMIHSGNKPVYQCSLCPTTCGRKTDLKIHFNKLHAVGSPLDCKKCGKAFSDRYSYKQHIRSHDMDRCFKCDQCDFVATTEKQLEVHISSHGKKYECDKCHLTFILKHLLDKHNVMFHSNKELSTGDDKMKDDNDGGFSAAVLNSKYDLTDLPSESEESSSLLSCAPSTSDTLHKNLMQDIKEGKLGDVPQVVIVHPDGSQEEISSKLTGDKWSIEELFCTATNNGHTMRPDEMDKEALEDSDSHLKQKKSEISPSSSSLRDDPNISSDNNNPSGLLQTTMDQVNDTAIMSEEGHHGMSQLCEASTQAEIESDTDSSGETPDHSSVLLSVTKAAQLSSAVDVDMTEKASGKQQNSKVETLSSPMKSLLSNSLLSSFATTDSSSDQLSAVRTSSSLSPSEQTATTLLPSSLGKSKNSSYLKSLMMQKPIVIKAPPNPSFSSSSSSLLTSTPLSSNKKLTSLLKFSYKAKPNVSTNPNLIVKHNSGGQQYSLLKNLNFSSSSFPHSTQSSPQSSSSSSYISAKSQSTNSSQLNTENNEAAVGKDSVVKLFVDLPTTSSGSDRPNGPNPDVNENPSSKTSAVCISNSGSSRVSSSLSSQILFSDQINSPSLSVTSDNDKNKISQIGCSFTTLNKATSSFCVPTDKESTTQNRCVESETILSELGKPISSNSNSACDADMNTWTTSITPDISQLAEATIDTNDVTNQQQIFVENDSNSPGKVHCMISSAPVVLEESGLSKPSTSSTASENVRTELAAFLQNRENEYRSKASQVKNSPVNDDDENDNDDNVIGSKSCIKGSTLKSKSDKLNVVDADGIIWTMVENVRVGGQKLGKETDSVNDRTCVLSHEDSSGKISAITHTTVASSTSGKDVAMMSSLKVVHDSSVDSLSEAKTPLASSPPPLSNSRRSKSGKRHADMDQSLVVPGKRVRKALVKISL